MVEELLWLITSIIYKARTILTKVNPKCNKEIIRNSINKEIRLEYFTNAKEFYEKLKIMCERLKELPRDDQTRNKEMRVYMKSFNNLINKLREEHSKRNDK